MSDSVTLVAEYSLPVPIGKCRHIGLFVWIPSVGAVIVQQLKVLSAVKNRSLEMERAVYEPAFNLT